VNWGRKPVTASKMKGKQSRTSFQKGAKSLRLPPHPQDCRRRREAKRGKKVRSLGWGHYTRDCLPHLP
jgi:hypothetical protein